MHVSEVDLLLHAEVQQSLHRQRLRQQAISAELPDISEEPEPASASGLTLVPKPLITHLSAPADYVHIPAPALGSSYD